MKDRKTFFKKALIVGTVAAVLSTVGVQSTAALWSDTRTAPVLTATGGAISGNAEMNGVAVPTTSKGSNVFESDAVTLSQANVDALVSTGKVAIPLKLSTSVTGMLAVQPTLSVSSQNWNKDSKYIEPSWKLFRTAGTCTYSDATTANFSAGKKALTLNGAGDSNSTPYVAGNFYAAESATYNFCLVGTTNAVDCTTGKVAIHTGYANACGTYTNNGSVKYNRVDGVVGDTTSSTTLNNITQKYSWSSWGQAVDKNTVKAGADTATVSIKLGYKVVQLTAVTDPYVSNTATPNIPTL